MPNSSRTPSMRDLLTRKDQALEESATRFLSADEKDDLANSKTPLVIHRVVMGEGNYGSRWELLLTVHDERVILTIPRNRGRDALMRAMQEECRRGAVTGIILTKDERADGTSFFYFAEAAEQTQLSI